MNRDYVPLLCGRYCVRCIVNHGFINVYIKTLRNSLIFYHYPALENSLYYEMKYKVRVR